MKAKNRLGSSHTNEEAEMLRLRYLESSLIFRIFPTFIELLRAREKRVDVIIGDSDCSVWVTGLKLSTER